MTQEQAADLPGLTERTVRSDRRKAEVWLAHELNR